MKQQVALAGYLLILSVSQVFAQASSQTAYIDGYTDNKSQQVVDAHMQVGPMIDKSAALNDLDSVENKQAVDQASAGTLAKGFERPKPISNTDSTIHSTPSDINRSIGSNQVLALIETFNRPDSTCSIETAYAAQTFQPVARGQTRQAPPQIINNQVANNKPAELEKNSSQIKHQDFANKQKKPSLLSKLKQNFSKTSNKVGTQWVEFADSLDQSLGGESYNKNNPLPNESYLRLQLGQTWGKGGELDTDVRLRARLDLPNSKQRLRLLLDNTDELSQSLGQEALGKTDSDNNIQSAALELTLKEDTKWRLSTSAGVRDLPLNPFVRVTVKRRDLLDFIAKNLEGRFKASVTYSKEDELFSDAFYLLSIPRDENSKWNNRIKVKWQDNDDEIELANIVSYDKKIDQDRNYTHAAGVIFTNKPSVKSSNYFLQSTYRKHLYGDILYLSITPTLEFPREGDFDLTPSINAKLSFYFRKQ